MANWKSRLVKMVPPLMVTALVTLGGGCWQRGLPTIDPGGDDTGSGGVQGRGGVQGGGGARGSGGAYGGLPHGTGAGGGIAASPNKLDVLFMVDDSASMAPLQAKLTAQLPAFVNSLKDPTTGQLRDLHVGVVSSSLGAGAWANVNQCGSGSHPGDDAGKFQQGPGGAGSGNCAMLNMGEKFLKSGDGTAANPPNFTGDAGTALQCLALLGDSGCGFESQFKAVLTALAKAADPMDPDNGGFLRADARLMIVMLTNEDDCSVADDSLLLDPGINSAMDPSGLGSLQSYRCNEFGHLCGGQPPPHGYDLGMSPPEANLSTGTYRTASGPGTGGVVLNGCVSADEAGKTETVSTPFSNPAGVPDPTHGHLYGTIPAITAAIKSFKTDPNDVFVAAIAGPTTDAQGQSLYRVFAQANPAAAGELDPVIDHSCVQATGADAEYADPAVRIHQWVDGFGSNGVFYPICANDFNAALTAIASAATH